MTLHANGPLEPSEEAVLVRDFIAAKDFLPPAGPHDRPELTNYDACPGCGSFPSQIEAGAEIDPGAG